MLVQSALAFLVLASMAIAPPPANPPTPEDTLLELILKMAEKPEANGCSKITPKDSKPNYLCMPPKEMERKYSFKQLDMIADRLSDKLKPTNLLNKGLSAVAGRPNKLYKQCKMDDSKGASMMMRGFYRNATMYVFCMGDGCDYQDQLTKEEQQKLTYGNYLDGTFPTEKAKQLYQKVRAKGYTEFSLIASDPKLSFVEAPKTTSLVAPIAWTSADDWMDGLSTTKPASKPSSSSTTKSDSKPSLSDSKQDTQTAKSIVAMLTKPSKPACEEIKISSGSIFSCIIKELEDGVTSEQANGIASLVKDQLKPSILPKIFGGDKTLHQQSIFSTDDGDKLLVRGMLPKAFEYVFCVGDGCNWEESKERKGKLTFAILESGEFGNWKVRAKDLEKGFVRVILKAKGERGNPPGSAEVIASI
jgi:hypothetical protein